MFRSVSPGNVPICPCSYSYWYPLYSASLSQHGQRTYLLVFVLVLVPLVQYFPWSARAMYLNCRCLYSYWYPSYSASLGQPGQCAYLSVFILVLVPLVQCFAWSARAMYLFARIRTRTGTPCTVLRLVSTGNVSNLPVFVLVLVPLVQCFAWPARAMYLFARACILVQCFGMGNPSHVRILVFGLSRCTCSATPTDMDSLLVMPRDGFYARCICAGCLNLTCRGAIVRLPVCTADREGGWQARLIYTMYIIHHVYI